MHSLGKLSITPSNVSIPNSSRIPVLTLDPAIPSADLFQSIDTILKSFPAPKQVRHSLLAHMHTLLHGTLQPKSKPTTPGERRDRAKRARIYASRALLPELEGEAMVDALRRCNEDLAASVRSQKTEEICEEYSNFIEGWFGQSLDEHFVSTLCLSALHALIPISIFNRISTS